MSDKGRKAIAKSVLRYADKCIDDIRNMLGFPHANAYMLADHIIIHILRSHGWLHLDDVVEGMYECRIMEANEDDDCENPMLECPDCEHMRPATVRDLIGKGGE